MNSFCYSCPAERVMREPSALLKRDFNCRNYDHNGHSKPGNRLFERALISFLRFTHNCFTLDLSLEEQIHWFEIHLKKVNLPIFNSDIATFFLLKNGFNGIKWTTDVKNLSEYKAPLFLSVTSADWTASTKGMHLCDKPKVMFLDF